MTFYLHTIYFLQLNTNKPFLYENFIMSSYSIDHFGKCKQLAPKHFQFHVTLFYFLNMTFTV